MAFMAEDELREVRETALQLRDALKVHLIPRDEADDRNTVIEVRAGAGGDEAALFAAELFRMYQRYCQRAGWAFEVISKSSMEAGGLREASASVQGDGAFGALKYESGVHRVQVHGGAWGDTEQPSLTHLPATACPCHGNQWQNTHVDCHSCSSSRGRGG